MNLPDPNDVDALLAILALPDPALPEKQLPPLEAVSVFIEDNDLRPGFSAGVEVCALYAFYLKWATESSKQEPITPMRFARALKKLGFRRRKRHQRRSSDRRLLGMQPECATRLRDWLAQHPLTEQDRALFDPVKRRAKKRNDQHQ